MWAGMDIYSLEEQRDMARMLQKHHELPTKYNYFGIGAKRWFRIAEARMKAGSKGINILERILLKQKVGSIFDSLSMFGYKNFNLIDLGCGDGSPTYPLFQYLRYSKSRAGLRYCPIDISSDMLRAASKNIKGGFGVYGEQNKFDLDAGSFTKITGKLRKPNFGNLFMFLGSTLGNMPDMGRMLANVKESMESTDYLLVGVELINPDEIGRMIRDYYNVQTTIDLIGTALDYLGVKRSLGEFRISFNRKLSQVECFFTPERDIPVDLAGKSLVLERGTAIMLARSVKFAAGGLVSLFSDSGYRTEMLTTSAENNYAIILAQPT